MNVFKSELKNKSIQEDLDPVPLHLWRDVFADFESYGAPLILKDSERNIRKLVIILSRKQWFVLLFGAVTCCQCITLEFLDDRFKRSVDLLLILPAELIVRKLKYSGKLFHLWIGTQTFILQENLDYPLLWDCVLKCLELGLYLRHRLQAARDFSLEASQLRLQLALKIGLGQLTQMALFQWNRLRVTDGILTCSPGERVLWVSTWLWGHRWAQIDLCLVFAHPIKGVIECTPRSSGIWLLWSVLSWFQDWLGVLHLICRCDTDLLVAHLSSAQLWTSLGIFSSLCGLRIWLDRPLCLLLSFRL